MANGSNAANAEAGPVAVAGDAPCGDFEHHRRHLTGLACRMLGSLAEAEDAVQDACIRWHRAEKAQIRVKRRKVSSVFFNARVVIDRQRAHMRSMEHFDFSAPADVFVGAGRKDGRYPMVYRRFDNGAEAIRHVIEAVAPASLPGAVVETDEARLDAAEIRAIYERTDFPLARRLNRHRPGLSR